MISTAYKYNECSNQAASNYILLCCIYSPGVRVPMTDIQNGVIFRFEHDMIY